MAPRTPTFKPTGTLNFTGGNVMVSGALVGLIVAIVWQASLMRNAFENRMNAIEWKLDAINKDKWTLSRQRDSHSAFWRDNPSLKMESSQPDIIAARIP